MSASFTVCSMKSVGLPIEPPLSSTKVVLFAGLTLELTLSTSADPRLSAVSSTERGPEPPSDGGVVDPDPAGIRPMSRKYRQSGYQDRKQPQRRSHSTPRFREGPRSPIMAGFRKVLKCAQCGIVVPAKFTDVSFASQCNRCGADLHACKNCVFFNPGQRFECSQPISERIARKDTANHCQYFEAKTTIEKITSSADRNQPDDARDAFEKLFRS